MTVGKAHKITYFPPIFQINSPKFSNFFHAGNMRFYAKERAWKIPICWANWDDFLALFLLVFVSIFQVVFFEEFFPCIYIMFIPNSTIIIISIFNMYTCIITVTNFANKSSLGVIFVCIFICITLLQRIIEEDFFYPITMAIILILMLLIWWAILEIGCLYCFSIPTVAVCGNKAIIFAYRVNNLGMLILNLCF